MPASYAVSFNSLLLISPFCLSLEGRSHGSLLCEFLGVQGFSEGRGLIGVGGYYGSAISNGVRCSSSVAGDGLQVLPREQVRVGAGQEAPQCTQRQDSPGEDGEEAESDGGSGSVGALGQWQLVWRGSLPLIGQKTEANEPQEAGEARENEVQQDGASSVLDIADGGKINVQDQEKDATKETGHTHSDTIVTGISVVVEDAEQTLAADVDVALIHDAAENHHGENPRKQPEEGAGIREEGDRIEGDAPGLRGAVRARWLHPSGVSAA